VSCNLFRGQVKLGEIEAVADVVTDVGVEEQSHSFSAKISITILTGAQSVDLWVCVQIPYSLDVYHNQVMTRSLKGEMTKGLKIIFILKIIFLYNLNQNL
jgi:hypothetical protein